MKKGIILLALLLFIPAIAGFAADNIGQIRNDTSVVWIYRFSNEYSGRFEVANWDPASGGVLDQMHGIPDSGLLPAMIEIYKLENGVWVRKITTNPAAYYTNKRVLAKGTYMVKGYYKPGYNRPQTPNFTIADNNQSTTVILKYTPLSAPLNIDYSYIRVKCKEVNEPLYNCEIELKDLNTSNVIKMKTDRYGQVKFENLIKSKSYEITAVTPIKNVNGKAIMPQVKKQLISSLQGNPTIEFIFEK